MSYESVPWTGASGADYLHHVFDIDANVPARLGNYVYCKKNEAGLWAPVYFGQGDLATRCEDAAIRECIVSKRATHVHLRLNTREKDRVEEMNDLLVRYGNAYAPEGCHKPEDRPAPALTESHSARSSSQVGDGAA